MKKVLFILFMVISTLIAQAQKGFEPIIRASYELGIDTDKNKSFGLDFLVGYRFAETIRIGLGTGIYWCEHLYENDGINKLTYKYYDEYRETAAYVPLFVNGKANFIKKGISPYLSVDLGYSFFIPFSNYAKNNKLGFMVKPALGVDFPINESKIFAEIGYKYQARKFDLNINDKMNYSQLSIAVGYIF